MAMTWDFPESNILGDSVGGFSTTSEYVSKCIATLPFDVPVGKVTKADAQRYRPDQLVMVSTDPPYYDNIGYADLSDFFYIWLRKNLRKYFPDLFETIMSPKVDELIANPHRFENKTSQARTFFEKGMFNTFSSISNYISNEYPLTVYYAFKQTNVDEENSVASTGWESMLLGLIQAGFSIVGTWPIRTEQSTRIEVLVPTRLPPQSSWSAASATKTPSRSPAATSSASSGASSSPPSPSCSRATSPRSIWRRLPSVPAWASFRAMPRCWKPTAPP